MTLIDEIFSLGSDGNYKGRGIYPVASLMNHSCICNTRNIIKGKKPKIIENGKSLREIFLCSDNVHFSRYIQTRRTF